MQKSSLALAVVIVIVVWLIIWLLIRNRENRNKKSPQPQHDEITLTSIGVAEHTFGGLIGPTSVYQALTKLDFASNVEFQSGGLLCTLSYPNDQEDGLIHGLHIVDVESGSQGQVVDIPCAVGWNMPGGPNFNDCRTDGDVKGWTLHVNPVRHWITPEDIQWVNTLSSPTINKYQVSWIPQDNVDVYAVSITLVGDSYNQDGIPVPTTLSFGGYTTGHNIVVTTGGSNYFTADVASVQSVKVVGFQRCDLGAGLDVCTGVQL